MAHLFCVSCGSNSPYMNLFMTLSKKCRLIEHLCLVSHHPLGKSFSTKSLWSLFFLFIPGFLKLAWCVTGNIDASTASHLIELVTKSPNLTSLTLLCFQLTNEIVRSLVEVYGFYSILLLISSLSFIGVLPMLLYKEDNICMLFPELSKTEVPESIQIT